MNSAIIVVDFPRVVNLAYTKYEAVSTFETRAQAREAIFGFIEIWYNRKRLHSYNDYLSPVAFEEKMLRNVTID